MGTKRIVMTTTQHREQRKTLREFCVIKAIDGGLGGNVQRIIAAAKKIEDYINTGKVK